MRPDPVARPDVADAPGPDIIEEAWRTAAQAAATAAVHLDDVHDPSTAMQAAALFDRVWGRSTDAASILAPEALLAIAHAGGQVTIATDAAGELVGATAAFVGLDDGVVLLHSHVTGVEASTEARGVGRALKWYQRAWCLQRGIGLVRWTYDPAIRRNAVINLIHLGAGIAGYEHDVYGSMPDARNASLPTDRLVVAWDLTAPRVRAAGSGRAAAPDADALRRTGAEATLDIGPDGGPVVASSDAPRRLVRIPEDIEALRVADLDTAAAWSRALREQLGAPIRAGFRVSGFTRDGWYVLTADRRVAELTDES
jgi:predicted GNAT superfamily acetyltransferase